MFIRIQNTKLQNHINDVTVQCAKALEKTNVINVLWASTRVIKVLENTSTKFDATLRDNMGEYRARITRSHQKVIVNFEGVGKRQMSVESAIWEFDMIWNDLKKQGVIVNALQ